MITEGAAEIKSSSNNLSFWNGKRVLVTGHTGFKGAWLCKILELSGAYVIGYALESPTYPNLFSLCKPEVHSIYGDIRDFDKLHAIFEMTRPEIVIHMAAQSLVLDSYKIPHHTYDVNIMGVVNVLECIRKSSSVKSLLSVTTDKVYLNKERSGGYSEDEELNGHDPYSNSKSCSELVTSSYNVSFLKQVGILVSTIRSGNVIGGGDFSANRLVPDCARALAKGELIKIRNPHAVRPFLHVLDTLFAYLKAVQKQYENPAFSGSYNIGPDEDKCATCREIADYFCEAWGNGAGWEHTPLNNPHESGILKLDCSKAKQMLGWKIKWDIEKTVSETAKWYQAYFQNEDANLVMTEQIKEFLQ